MNEMILLKEKRIGLAFNSVNIEGLVGDKLFKGWVMEIGREGMKGSLGDWLITHFPKLMA